MATRTPTMHAYHLSALSDDDLHALIRAAEDELAARDWTREEERRRQCVLPLDTDAIPSDRLAAFAGKER